MIPTILDDYVRQVTYRGAVIDEQRLRVLLQPRPRWCPPRIWNRILRRVIVVEHR